MVTPTDSLPYLNRRTTGTVSSFDKESVKHGMKSPRNSTRNLSSGGGQQFPRISVVSADESSGKEANAVSPSSLASASRKNVQWNMERDIPAGAVRNNPFAIKESTSPRKKKTAHKPSSPNKTIGGNRGRQASLSHISRDSSSTQGSERIVPGPSSPRGESPKSGSSPWQQHAKSFSAHAEVKYRQPEVKYKQQPSSQPIYSNKDKKEGNRNKRWEPSREIPNGTVKGRVSTLFGQAKPTGVKPKESAKPTTRTGKGIGMNVTNRNITSKGDGDVDGVDQDEGQWIITERNRANTQVSASAWGEAVVSAKSAESDDWDTPAKEWIRSGESQTESSLSNRMTRTSANQKSSLHTKFVKDSNEANKDSNFQDTDNPRGRESEESDGWEIPSKDWSHSGELQLESSVSKRAIKTSTNQEPIIDNKSNHIKTIPETDRSIDGNSGQGMSKGKDFISGLKKNPTVLAPPPKDANAYHHNQTQVRPSSEISSLDSKGGGKKAHSFESSGFQSDFKIDSMDDIEFATPFPTQDTNQLFQPRDANADVFGFPLAPANEPGENRNIGEIVGGEEFFDASISVGSERPVIEDRNFDFDRFRPSAATNESRKYESDDNSGQIDLHGEKGEFKKRRKSFLKGLFGRKSKDKDNGKVMEPARGDKKLLTRAQRSYSKSSMSDSLTSPSGLSSQTSIQGKSQDIKSTNQNGQSQSGILSASNRTGHFTGSSQTMRVSTALTSSSTGNDDHFHGINSHDKNMRNTESKGQTFTNGKNSSEAFSDDAYPATAIALKDLASEGLSISSASPKRSELANDDVFDNLDPELPVSFDPIETMGENYVDPELDHLDMEINSEDDSNSRVSNPSKRIILQQPSSTQPKHKNSKPSSNKDDERTSLRWNSSESGPSQNSLKEARKDLEKAQVYTGGGGEETPTKMATKLRENDTSLADPCKPMIQEEGLDSNLARQVPSKITPSKMAMRMNDRVVRKNANNDIACRTRICGTSDVQTDAEGSTDPIGANVGKNKKSNTSGITRFKKTSLAGKDSKDTQETRSSTVRDIKASKLSTTNESSKYPMKGLNAEGTKSRFSAGIVIPQKKSGESKILASHSRKSTFQSRVKTTNSQNTLNGPKKSSNVESSIGMRKKSLIFHKDENGQPADYKARQQGDHIRFPRKNLLSRNSNEVIDRDSHSISSELDGQNKKIFSKSSHPYRNISKKNPSEDSDEQKRCLSIAASTSASDISCSSSTYDNYQKKLAESLRKANIVTQNSYEFSLHSHKSLDDSSIESDIRVLKSILRRPRLDYDNATVITASRQVKGFPTYDVDSATDPMQRVGLRLLSSAIIPIQTEVRRFLAMRRALTRMWALIVVQTYTRRFLAMNQYQKMQYSVVTIQAAVRGHLVRNDIIDKHICAIEIQRFVRGYLATMEVYEEIYKVTLIQSLVRMKIAMDDAAYRISLVIQLQAIVRGFMVRQQRARLDKCATVIQSSWRCFYNRLTYQFDLLDIIIIQSLWRRKLGVRAVARIVQDKRNAAATVIQAQWRAYDCKMDFLCYLSARRIQTKWRSHSCRTKYVDYQACSLIQSGVRMFLCRSRYVEYQASTAIQSAVRMYFCRTDYIDYLCAKRIQAIARMYLCRSKYIEYQCASKIQSMGRMYLCRSDYLEYQAARTVQSIGRMYLCRSDYLQYRAATVIQSIGRMYLRRYDYVYYQAAKSIQSIARMYLCRYDYVDYQAAKTIQSIARMYLCRYDYVEYQAAKAIQSIGRMYLCRYDYVEYKAARDIQSIGRMYLCRSDYVEYRAARAIQSIGRMYSCRSDYVEYRAARVIQTSARMRICRSHYVEYQAAKLIQSIGRMYLCRYDFVEYMAARAIQSIGRMYLCRHDYVEYVAARRIQAAVRMYRCRSYYIQYRSASAIQAAWRCHDCRMDYLFYISSRKIQSIGRMFVCRTKYIDYRAATRIQTIARMFMLRSKYVEYQASTRIQAMVRMFLCRSQYLYDLSFMAARLIQTRWRCHVHRERYVTFTSSRLIQKQWRAYVCRKIYIENFAATMIQTKWRSYDCSSMYKRYCSARIIQKTWRSYDCQMNFLHFLADILIVQSTIRRFLVQRRVKAMKDRAATAIQREYRRYACLTSYKQTVAAITIQRTWRGFVCFADYAEFKAARKVQTMWRKHVHYQKYTRYMAARKVQTAWRKHLHYQRYTRYIAARKVQSMWRKHLHYQMYTRYIAARKVQSMWRKHLHYQMYTTYMAARKLQTVWRKHVNYQRYSRYIAARKVQAAWRGFVNYADYQEFLTVRKIQTAWRAYHHSNNYQRYRASVKIQTAVRCKLCQIKYQRYVAARKIQSAWRGLIRYIDYHEYLTVRKIQTSWRGFVCRRKYEREISAIKIQSAWRGFLVYADYMFELSDIVVVQKEIRGWLARREVKKRRINRDYNAATTIQKYWRRWVDEIEFLRMTRERHACTIIQKNWRRFWCFSNFIIALDCSIQIQAHVRGHIQNRKYSAQKFAAVAIQTAWRTANAKKVASQLSVLQQVAHSGFDVAEKESGAATKIQRLFRGSLCRTALRVHLAAVLIQSRVRGKQARTAVRLYIAVRKIQAAWRAFTPRQSYVTYIAARKIQATWRRYIPRQGFVTYIAARSIQNSWRSAKAKKILYSLRNRFNAASLIQSAWRGFVCYTDFVFTLSDIVAAQRIARGYLSRKKYSSVIRLNIERNKSQLKGAVLLQRIYRGFQARQRYWYTLGCAMQIQSWWRGRHTYHLVQNKLNAILTLQCFARCSLARQQYMQRRFVFMLIQTAEQERTKKIVALRMKEQVRDDMEERQRDEAARVIQRFFVNVKDEADELILATKRRKKWRKNMKRERHTDNVEEAFLEDVWLGLVAQNNFEEPFTRNYIDIGLDFGGKGSSRVPRHQIDDDDQSQFSLFEGAPARMTFKRHPNSSIQLVRKVDAIDLDDDFQLEEAFIDAEICNAKVLKNVPGINEGRKEYTTTLNSSMSVMKVDAESRNEKNQRGGIVTHKARVDDSHLGQNHQTQSNILTMSNHY